VIDGDGLGSLGGREVEEGIVRLVRLEEAIRERERVCVSDDDGFFFFFLDVNVNVMW
jgi:hypothetical protein